MTIYPLKHLVALFYISLALFIVYFPPRATQGLGKFVQAHFGDSVGLYILHLGIALVVLSSWFQWLQGVSQTGQSLILAGMVALKLTKPPVNGNEPPKP